MAVIGARCFGSNICGRPTSGPARREAWASDGYDNGVVYLNYRPKV
jgi:hypothetical protein